MKILVIGAEKEEALQLAREISEKLGLPLCEDTRISSRSADNLDDNAIYFAADVKYSQARAWFFDVIISYRPSTVYCKALKEAMPTKLYKLVNENDEPVFFNGQPCNALIQSSACILRQKVLDETNILTKVVLDMDSMKIVNSKKQLTL